MAKKVLTNLDLNKNEIQNVRVQNLASAPQSPVEGQIYFNTTDHKFYIYNGSAWIDLTSATITVDSELSDVSENPVQNKVVKGAIDGKVAKTTTIAGVDLQDNITAGELKTALGLGTVYNYKGTVANYAALSNIVDPVAGDVYNVTDTGKNYAWTGTEWDDLGGTVDLSGYVQKTTTIAGIDLQDNITVNELKAALGVTAGLNKFTYTITGDGSQRIWNIDYSSVMEVDFTQCICSVYDSNYNEVIVDTSEGEGYDVYVTFAQAPAQGATYYVVIIG